MFEILTKPNCIWCDKAKDMLIERGIPFMVTEVPEEDRMIVAAKYGWQSFPIIFHEKEALIGGYKELQSYLDESLKVRRLHDQAILPTRGSKDSAGLDLCFSSPDIGCMVIQPGDRVMVETGLSIEIPEGHYGRVAPRSGLAAKKGIDVLAGVIDRDYRGEVKVILLNTGSEDFHISRGDRIAQLILEKVSLPEIIEVTTNTNTERGIGGFGSTGSR